MRLYLLLYSFSRGGGLFSVKGIDSFILGFNLGSQFIHVLEYILYVNFIGFQVVNGFLELGDFD